MVDLIRLGLFALSLAAVLLSSAALVSSMRLGGAGSLLALWVVGTGQVVLLAEALSLLHALDWPGFLAGHLLILGGVAVSARRRPGGDRWRALREVRTGLARLRPLVLDWDAPALPILAVAALVVGLVGLLLALWIPPTTWDVLSYHLPRVGYYLQFRSLDHYPSDDPRQVAFPVNAELLILWTAAFLRADWLANTVQLVAWAVTTVGVYGVGRQIGLRPRAALVAAGAFALLPPAVRQSATSLNDLVVASFVVASMYFLLRASGQWTVARGQSSPTAHCPLPTAHSLVLAGAAAGLAVGTKGTALLALPGLAVAFLVLFGRRLTRRVLGGLLLGGVAAALLGSYVYVQNWHLYGTPIAPAFALESGVGVMTGQGFVANLGRILFTFVFADLTGPLNDPRARPLAAPLAGLLGAVGERIFALFGVPTVVEGVDVPWWPPFTFVRTAQDFVPEGPGPIGGLMLVLAMVALAWPARSGREPRLLGLAALGYLVAMALTLRWNASAGRFLLTACALAAPLLGVAIERLELSDGGRRWRRAFVLVVAVWSAASGLYALGLHDPRAIAGLAGRDRIGLLSRSSLVASHEPLFREVEEELGPTAVAVYDTLSGVANRKDQWEYPFFGPRFSRPVVPLVRPEYAERMGLVRPLAWTNERLVAAYRPSYVAVAGRRPAGGALAQIGLEECFPIPLRHGKPGLPWELWRCEDQDPRSVLEHGDFSGTERLPEGWDAEVAGEGRLAVSRAGPAPSAGEPFRLRLEYRANGDADGEGGIVQEVSIGGLRGRMLVVDARVRTDLAGAAVLWVDDGVTATETANGAAGAETLRVTHRVDPRATGLWVHLDASGAGRDAAVLVRTILAIPRPE